jgi:hypothetical protein
MSRFVRLGWCVVLILYPRSHNAVNIIATPNHGQILTKLVVRVVIVVFAYSLIQGVEPC